ncbi:MAG TPA: hypothetical protein PLZ60_13065, partial [Kiritimatiellia bacterium]|nr:hypothetical protein [Kiritimatiellia bacterium]
LYGDTDYSLSASVMQAPIFHLRINQKAASRGNPLAARTRFICQTYGVFAARSAAGQADA